MSLTYSRLPGSTRIYEGNHIARDGTIYIYYIDEPIDYLKELHPDDANDTVSTIVDDIVDDLNVCSISTKLLIDLDNDIISKEVPSNRHCKRIYSKAKDTLASMESKFYRAYNKLVVLPTMVQNQVDCFYVVGGNGSGKSTWSSNFALQYLQSFPGNRIFLFSRKDFDPILDSRVPGIIRIRLDRNFVKNFSNDDALDSFSNSLVIFDDFSLISDKIIVKAVQSLKNSLLELGRQYGTSVISIQHKALSGMKSTTEFSECSAVVFFPRKNMAEIDKALRKYFLFDNISINRILDDEGKRQRWICIVKPNIVITEDYIKIID